MVALTPAPASLGLSSPALGPWFSRAALMLPVPNPDLSVSLTLQNADRWLPPTSGLLSLFIATAPRPRGLAALRQANGDPAFTPGQMVALFRMLPEAEERLHSLMSNLPSVDGNAATVPTRSRVRYFALEFAAPTMATLVTMITPTIPGELTTDGDRAAYLGLSLSGSTLGNDTSPMSDLKRAGFFTPPGGGAPAVESLLTFPAGGNVTLWCFDALGRAIDPGAVAAWWNFLANTVFDNLWGPGITSDEDQRTVGVANQLTVHLVNAHEGAIGDLIDRLNFDGFAGTGVIRTRDAAGAGAVTFIAAPDPDNAPVPKMALLPNGTYGDTVTLWGGGAVGTPAIARDFVRVAAIDIESHLIGQSRIGTGRRAQDQNRVSTRVNVAQSSGQVLLGTTDLAADAISNVCAQGVSQVVTSVCDRDCAGLDALTLPNVALPDALPNPLTITALVGGGTATGGTITGQRALLETSFNPSFSGAWVRAWTQNFDPVQGRHIAMEGGGGRVRSDGTVTLVMTLPDGDASPTAKMGVSILLVTSQGSRTYADQRFNRPAPVGGNAIAHGNASITDLILCEIGQEITGNTLPNNSVASGVTVVARIASSVALVDRSTIPASVFTADTLVRTLQSGSTIDLTQPAFRGVPEGNAVGSLPGITVNRRARNGLNAILAAGAPLPTQEKLEIVASSVVGTNAFAAIATTPLLSRYHELLPHQLGHPGAPAAIEIHGTGAAITGPAAIAFAEITRDRINHNTVDLVTAAATPLPTPTAVTSPSRWVAALQTVAAGVTAEPGLASAIVAPGAGYPFGGTLDAIRAWLTGQGITIPAGLDAAADSIVRALDRRLLMDAFGAREGATSLQAAIQRAEDLIYIETPAIDALEVGNPGDTLNLWQTLIDRMNAKPALQVVLCLPIRTMPGTPAPLSRIRDKLVIDVVQNLQSGDRGDRIAIFSPSAGAGRTLRIAATTVIVDDVYALTGTTHLWRRGLSFDASVAISMFDEVLTQGRPAEVRQLRQSLIAGRLGLAPTLVPDDPAELVHSVQLLVARGGRTQLASSAITTPDPVPTTNDIDAWNRDGSPQTALGPVGWIIGLAADVRSQLEDAATGP